MFELDARLGGIFFQDFLERGDKEVRIGLRKNQRRTELDDVVMWAVCAGEDAAFAEAVHDVSSLVVCGLASLAIEDQIQPQEQA